MGVFREIKTHVKPEVLKSLNKFLAFSTRIGIAKTTIQFLNGCIQLNRYPKFYFKNLRRTHVTPTWKSLKRYALNQIDECKLKTSELERLRTLHEVATHELPNSLFQRFTEYASEIVDSQCLKKKQKLQNSLHAPTPQLKFPDNPRLYVHKFSDVVLNELQLEALSLGPKFCGYRENTKQHEIDIQFENLMSQTVGLIPSSEENLDRFKTTLVECSHRFHGYKTQKSFAGTTK